MNKEEYNNYLNLVLELEKNMALTYSIFLNESSNDYLYENIFSMMEDSFDMAREVYDLMFKYGLDIEEVNDTKRLNLIKCLENKLKMIEE